MFSHVFCLPLREVVVNTLYMSAQLWDEKLACGGLFPTIEVESTDLLGSVER